jgi:hypothetical protein
VFEWKKDVEEDAEKVKKDVLDVMTCAKTR